MTWGETASVSVKLNTQRENKVAVSPSRPMISYLSYPKHTSNF
jgi:hypothetical protein